MSKSSEPELAQVIKFLLGECELEGRWFNDFAQPNQGMYWWRTHLRAALEALSNQQTTGRQSTPAANPEPVESLEATVIDCLDSARKGDDPNALGYYLMGEIDKALQKARIDGAAKFVEEGWGKRCETKDLEDFPELAHDPKGSRCGTCEMWEHYDEWVKELRG